MSARAIALLNLFPQYTCPASTAGPHGSFRAVGMKFWFTPVPSRFARPTESPGVPNAFDQ
jgi:hypothetical protein